MRGGQFSFALLLAATLGASLGLARLANGQYGLTCEKAEELHLYAVKTLGSCEDPATQNTPLCGLIGEALEDNFNGNYTSPASELVSSYDQLGFIFNPVTSLGNWQNYLIQSAVTSVADIGEIAYILNNISDAYNGVNSTDITNEEYYGLWQPVWWDQADYNVQLAANSKLDALSRVALNFKAANYYFTGAWPYAFSAEAIEATDKAAAAFRAGLNAHPTWKYVAFNVSFNNGSATAQLPGIFITPDATKKLPVIIFTTGTDYTKEETFLQFSRDTLARGYAVLVYEGPGQGNVLRKAPHMPFFAQWDQVLLVILDYVRDNLSQYVQLDKVVQNGVSLGGYLGSRGCAGHSDRLAACVPNPPQTAVAPTYNRFVEALGSNIYAPFLYVQENQPSLLPEKYRKSWTNYNNILYTLLLTCKSTSSAPQLITDTFVSTGGVIDPELIYLAGGYGGVVSGDEDVIYSGIWQGFNNVQRFNSYNVANISCPVIAFKGTEDDLLGGEEDEFYSLLTPSVRQRSTLYTYDSPTGGALHCQVGASNALTANLFSSLTPILQGGSPAPSQAPATLPILPATNG